MYRLACNTEDRGNKRETSVLDGIKVHGMIPKFILVYKLETLHLRVCVCVCVCSLIYFTLSIYCLYNNNSFENV